ncbi:aspergillopepsin [Penicillium chermesinum]|nr:aspergillopepsin [Penicillium chermesinum]
MKFSTVAIGASVLASAALASPLSKRSVRQSTPAKKLVTDVEAQTVSSSNWAGAVLQSGTVSSVTGTFTVPTPQAPNGGDPNTNYCAAIWVGIDGSSCQSAILQTGVNVCIQNGVPSYGAWYEWFPQAMIGWDSSTLSINAGDQIRATVSATADNAGTATVENLSNGQTGTYTWNGDVQGDLCMAEESGFSGGPVPFANFGSVTFSDASATVNGAAVGPDNADIWDMDANGQELATAYISNGQVIVNYG